MREWLLAGLRENAGLTVEQETEAVAKHFVAVSTALDKVEAFGIYLKNAFGFVDAGRGRYSAASAIGTVLATVLGRTSSRSCCPLPRDGPTLPTAPATCPC